MKSQFLKLWALLITIMISGMVCAQERIYHDLDDMRANNLDNAMESKGYVHIKTEDAGDHVYGYWWNYRTKSCACTHVTDGRVKSVVKTSSLDCNKSNEGVANHYNSYQHTINDHDNNRHYDNAGLENAFEQGYLDGLHHKSYSNPYPGNAANKSEAYARGYTSGDAKRTVRTRHHSGDAGYTNKGSSDYVEYKDLIGHEARPVYVQLEQRGFAELHTKEYNGYVHRIYHNRDTGQCIETLERGEYISDIHHYANCNQFMK